MNWIVAKMKWLMLVSGALTLSACAVVKLLPSSTSQPAWRSLRLPGH